MGGKISWGFQIEPHSASIELSRMIVERLRNFNKTTHDEGVMMHFVKDLRNLFK
jgi:hypothetical protein